MARARVASECTVKVKNEIGAGAKVAECVARAGVNLTAVCGYGYGEEAHFLLIPDDAQKASSALQAGGFSCEMGEVAVVEAANRPGAMADILRRVADAGIDVDYAYASASGSGDALCVLKVADAARAVTALNG